MTGLEHMPIADVLTFVIVCGLASILVLSISGNQMRRPRLVVIATVAGLVCAMASGALRRTRHAGTGTQTAWGWPRIMHTRWVSWETPEKKENIRLQGVVENAVFYGAAAMLVGSLVVAVRRKQQIS